MTNIYRTVIFTRGIRIGYYPYRQPVILYHNEHTGYIYIYIYIYKLYIKALNII